MFCFARVLPSHLEPSSPWSKAIPGLNFHHRKVVYPELVYPEPACPSLLNHILGSNPEFPARIGTQYASGPVVSLFDLEERSAQCVYSDSERYRGICFCRVRTSLTTGLAIHTQAQNHFNPGMESWCGNLFAFAT